MKAHEINDRWQVTNDLRNEPARHAPLSPPRVGAFTMIEIMMVVAIMGIVLAMGMPSILRALRREGMRKAVTEVQEICSNARARAILSGTMTEVVFHPRDLRLEISGAAPAQAAKAPATAAANDLVTATPGGGSTLYSTRLPSEISIQMLDVNLLEYRDSQEARVRFFPNGTSDEMRLVLLSNKGEQRGIELEISTGLPSVVPNIREWLTR